MIKDNKILIGKANDKEVYILPSQMNRHGLIAGASGTGKTITLKVVAESLSDLEVPVFISDVKGDLSGMIIPAEKSNIQKRLDSMGVDFDTKRYPVHFFDVYGKNGHPLRVTIEDMGPLLLSRILNLTEAQEGVLNIIFRVAKDMNIALYDLKDLQAMASYVGENASEYTIKYGNVSKASVGAILRSLLILENEGGEDFFGQPSIDIEDWFYSEDGQGIMNILDCRELVNKPNLYSTFIFWLLTNLYERLPEVGDLEKPRMVFFFDEAHFLFSGANSNLMEKIIQTVKLIRSKGVGVFFITQSPTDIPNEVLAQLSNRVQHSLRAYTPTEIKGAKMAAQSFRENPDLDVATLITNMETGYALVSCLDEKGAPSIVEHTKILPPQSSMGMASMALQQNEIKYDSLFGKYENEVDNLSAFEEIENIIEEKREQEELEKQRELKEKEDLRRQKEEEKEALRRQRELERQKARQTSLTQRIQKKTINKLENEASKMILKTAGSFLKNILKK